MDCKSSHFKLWEAWHCFHMEPICTILFMGPSVFQSQLPFPGSSRPHVDPWFQAEHHIHSSLYVSDSFISVTRHSLFSPSWSHLPPSSSLHPNGLTLWSRLSSTLPSALASSPFWRAEGVINYFYLSFAKAHGPDPMMPLPCFQTELWTFSLTNSPIILCRPLS